MKIAQSFINNSANIIAAIQANNFNIVDDHNSGTRVRENVRHFVEYTVKGKTEADNRSYICMVVPGNVVSLNPVYIAEDGTVHISTSSVGPAFDMRQDENVQSVADVFNLEYSEANYDFLRNQTISATYDFTTEKAHA